MTKQILMDFIDELADIGKRYDYILGQYEPEDSNVVKPFRKIESQMLSEITKLQSEFDCD